MAIGKRKTLNQSGQHSRGVPKKADGGLAPATNRWNSDLMPCKSSEKYGSNKAIAAVGNFARGSRG
jgi:hypothetical protein